MFNAELSAERYWQEPRSQESGEGGREGGGGGRRPRPKPNATAPPQLFCILTGSRVSRFNVSFTGRGKATRQYDVKKKNSRSGIEPTSVCLPA